jgi:hypothetical protein
MACMNHGMAQMTDSLDLHAALRKGVKEYRAVCSEHYQYVLFQDGEHSLYLIGNTHI